MARTWKEILRHDAGTTGRRNIRIEGKHEFKDSEGHTIRVLLYTRRTEQESPKDELHWETRLVVDADGKPFNSIIIHGWFTNRNGDEVF